MISIPSLDSVTRMERRRDERRRPGPHIAGLVVESPNDRMRLIACIEGNHISDRAHPSVGSARASEEGSSRVRQDLRSSERGDALPFDRATVRLPLVTVERPSLVCNLERNSHAKEYRVRIYR